MVKNSYSFHELNTFLYMYVEKRTWIYWIRFHKCTCRKQWRIQEFRKGGPTLAKVLGHLKFYSHYIVNFCKKGGRVGVNHHCNACRLTKPELFVEFIIIHACRIRKVLLCKEWLRTAVVGTPLSPEILWKGSNCEKCRPFGNWYTYMYSILHLMFLGIYTCTLALSTLFHNICTTRSDLKYMAITSVVFV